MELFIGPALNDTASAQRKHYHSMLTQNLRAAGCQGRGGTLTPLGELFAERRANISRAYRGLGIKIVKEALKISGQLEVRFPGARKVDGKRGSVIWDDGAPVLRRAEILREKGLKVECEEEKRSAGAPCNSDIFFVDMKFTIRG